MTPGAHSSRGDTRALALLLCAGALPALAVEASYEVAARADVRGRTALSLGTAPWAAEDVELLPSAQGSLRSTQWLLTARYHPSVLFSEPHALGSITGLHRGRLAFNWQGQRTSLRLLQEAAQGTLDVGPLRLLDGAVLPREIPLVETLGLVPYVRSGSWVSLGATPNDRVSLSLTAGYVISGNPEFSFALPLQWGPLGSAQVRWGTSRVDTLTTTVRAMASWFATDQQQLILQLSQTWERRLAKTMTGYLGGGVAYTREQIPALPIVDAPIPGTYREVLPVASVGLRFQRPVRGAVMRLDANARMEPYADRFTGFVYERLEAHLEFEWRPLHEVTVQGDTGLAYAMPIGIALQTGDRMLFAESTVAWQTRDWLAFRFAARALWVQQPRLGGAGQIQALGVVSAVLQAQDTASW